MKDTTEEILALQTKIFMSKPLEERFAFAMQMIDDGMELVRSSVRNDMPGISAGELKAEVFKRMYSKDFNVEELNEIAEYLKNKTK